MASLLFAVSIHAIIQSELTLPYGRRRASVLYEFSGLELFLPVLSLILAGIGFAAIIVDHYDKRPNEYGYKALVSRSIIVGYFLYFISVFIGHKVT